MSNQLKKWFAVLMAMILGMPGYGLSLKDIITKAEDDESITIHIENKERHVQTGETVSLLDGVSVEGSGEENYRAVVGDVQEQDSGLSLYEEGMEELVIPEEAAGKSYRVLYKAQSSIDNEVWNDVEGSEKEAKLIVEGSRESEEVTAPEENKEETSEEECKEEEKQEENKEEETPQPITVILQGKEKEEAEVGEVFSFVHDDNVMMNIPEEDEKDYRIIVTEVNTPENGSYSYKEGDTSFIPQKGDEGLTYIIHYGVETSKDGAESFERVEGVSFTKEVTVITVKKVTIQGEEERTILAENEYDFIRDSDLVVKGPKEEENSYRLKVKEVKSPENGSYQYHEGDESFTPKESDEGLVYEVTYVAETSKDGTTWKEVEDVQFIQKLTVAVFRAEEVRGPLATEAILCKGTDFQTFVKNWNTGSTIKVKNLVKADVPSDLISASLRYKYETISDPSSPVKIYMWHDMNAYGQYVDTVYFGTEVPGATIYTNPDASEMFSYNHGYGGMTIDKIYDSANPSTPYFFNTSKTTNISNMFSSITLSTLGIPFDCTNGNNVSPFGLMDTSSVTRAEGVFSICKYVDLTGIENWDMSHVKSISGMFRYCNHMDFSPITNWDPHDVEDVSALFYNINEEGGCTIPWGIGNWHLNNLKDARLCFVFDRPYYNGTDLEINVTNWNFSNAVTEYQEPTLNPWDPPNPIVSFMENYHISKIGIGAHFLDKDGKFNAPYKNDGAWKNEVTGKKYFHMAYYPYGNEFQEKYTGDPVGMSGVYVPASKKVITVTYYKEHGADNEYYFEEDIGKSLTIKPALPSSPGKTFLHWETSNLGVPDGVYHPGDTFVLPDTRSIIFSPKYAYATYTMNYDLDGGTNDPFNPTTYTEEDAIKNKVFIVKFPTKPGKFFIGWTRSWDTDPDPKPRLTDSFYFPSGGGTLKAHWAEPKNITIHGLYAHEGSLTGSTDVTVTIPDPAAIRVSVEAPPSYGNLYVKVAPSNSYFTSSDYYNFNYYKKSWVIDSASAGGRTPYRLAYDSAGTRPMGNGDIGYAKVIEPAETDIYVLWKYGAKRIYVENMPSKTYIKWPDGSLGNRDNISPSGIGKEQWDEDSPNITVSIKGHETGAANEYVLPDIGDDEWTSPYKSYLITSFTISVEAGSSHTYPTGNLTSYTFTGGFDKDVTITVNRERVWRVQYLNTDDTPITAMQTIRSTDLPYIFRSTYPPHADWNDFRVLPIGWTINKYNTGTSAEGIYTSTGNLPTLFRGAWNATQFDTVQSPLKLYPLYSVDVNNDGIPDLFQNRNILTVSKKKQWSAYANYNIDFPYDVYLNDVHGNPIKNWKVEDTDGNTYTTNTSGVIHLSLKQGKSLSIKGILPNMIVRAVETDTKGMTAEYAISYNGTSFTSGSDTGNVTYQDNTPLTFTFRNTDNRTIVPAGIKDTNTRVYVLLGAVLIALAFSIHMLKVRRRT